MPAVAMPIPAAPRHPIRSRRNKNESTASASGDTEMIQLVLVALVVTRPGNLHEKVEREDRTACNKRHNVASLEPQRHTLQK